MPKHKISNLKWYAQVKRSSSAKQETADMLGKLYNGVYYPSGAPAHIAKAQKLIRDDAVVAHMATYALKWGPSHNVHYTARQADALALEQFNKTGKTRGPFWKLAELAGRAEWASILKLAFEENESIKSTDGRGGARANSKGRRKAGASHGTDKPANHSTAKVETATELAERSVPKFENVATFSPWGVSAAQRLLDGIHQSLNALCDEAHKEEVLAIEKEARDLIARIKKLAKAS